MKKKITLCLIGVSLLLAGSVFSLGIASEPEVNCTGAVGSMTYKCYDTSEDFCTYYVEGGQLTLCVGELETNHNPGPVIND
jgi:hypothetical protein